MMLISYWAFGNRQTFYSGDSEHKLIQFTAGIDHIAFLLILAPFILCSDWMLKFFFAKVQEAEKSVASFNYWECMNGMDQKIWFAQETYARKMLGINSVDEVAYKTLQKSKRSNLHLAGAHNYDILSNKDYRDRLAVADLH
jgi:hypothetical protein